MTTFTTGDTVLVYRNHHDKQPSTATVARTSSRTVTLDDGRKFTADVREWGNSDAWEHRRIEKKVAPVAGQGAPTTECDLCEAEQPCQMTDDLTICADRAACQARCREAVDGYADTHEQLPITDFREQAHRLWKAGYTSNQAPAGLRFTVDACDKCKRLLDHSVFHNPQTAAYVSFDWCDKCDRGRYAAPVEPPKTMDAAVELAYALRSAPLPDEERWGHTPKTTCAYCGSRQPCSYNNRIPCCIDRAACTKRLGELLAPTDEEAIRIGSLALLATGITACTNCGGRHHPQRCPQIGAALIKNEGPSSLPLSPVEALRIALDRGVFAVPTLAILKAALTAADEAALINAEQLAAARLQVAINLERHRVEAAVFDLPF